MRKMLRLQLACAAVVALLCVGHAGAFNTSIYATQSKLSTGKWVKVSIPENGMYEITYAELREMGFSNPSHVHVYGVGGNRISEVLNGTASDDLTQIPIHRSNDKICFYGNGPISFSLVDYTTTPRFTRTFNPYSRVGCYFLTEESSADLTPVDRTIDPPGTFEDRSYSYDFFYHERELESLSNSGKEMLGEDFFKNRLLVDYYLPHLSDSSIVVHSCIAAYASDVTYASAVIHSGGVADTMSYSKSMARISIPSKYAYYTFASPSAVLKMSKPDEHGQYEPLVNTSTESGTVDVKRLDYFILSYQHENIMTDAPDAQLFMANGICRNNMRFLLPNASPNTVVWFINTPNSPQVVNTTAYNNLNGSGRAFYASPISRSTYVAFDPTKTLKKISSYTPVANQNLHGMAVPELLIITTDAFKEQADRLADLHRAVDGIDVAVVTQEQVFNEFSSGTRDAMAYRLLCKMLYDRDGAKFKNLLLFGTGSFDNREFTGAHPDDLLTYQSDNSHLQDVSYTSDDFFGYLDDNSGTNIANEKLRIGVGRITCMDAEEARSDVDKIVEYYANPDYGVWRNKAIVASDSYDKGEFMFQGQGYENQIDNDLNTGMHVNTVHDSMYPRSTTEPFYVVPEKTATEARRKHTNVLKEGAYFYTYVGHAGPAMFTKQNRMWTIGDVDHTSYPHFPIMSTVCCNVAHFDNDSRGIAERMLHKRDGGAIALLTSSRMVFASENDRLNQYFLNKLFSYDRTDVMPTLGEAYKETKLEFKTTNTNKMQFLLLGDPAIRVNYPISRFKITSVNGTNVTGQQKAQVRPLQQFEVKAQVLDAEGNIDVKFNGDATVTLYDREDLFVTLNFQNSTTGAMEARDVHFDRAKLAEISGRVVNGQFTGMMVAPQSTAARNQDVLIRVYAHMDDSEYMVNGFTKQVTMLPYDASLAITDTQAPVITRMFLNDDATFVDGTVVPTNSILYIQATDNEGINIQPNALSGTMKLQLDGGKHSYDELIYYADVADGCKTVNIEMPLSILHKGLHTLTYTVSDLLGNTTSRTILFVVGESSSATLVADKMPAFLDGNVQFNIEAELSIPEMTVRVTDALGRPVWKTKASGFPVVWDLKDMDGKKVAPGLYRYYGTFSDGVNYGGTPINNLIVLDPVKTASNN